VSAPGDRVADAGLQSERTYLAWQRTGLSFAGVGALLVHVAGGVHHPLAAVPGILGLAVGAAVLLGGFVRYRSAVAAARGEGAVATGNLAVIVAAAAFLLGVAGLAVIV
jgi:uncharacterized membrane protein YidH (DUF202 family)